MTYLCASVSKQYNLVPAKGMISLAGKVTVGLVESNGSLPPGLWLTVGQLPRNWDQLPFQCWWLSMQLAYFTVQVMLNTSMIQTFVLVLYFRYVLHKTATVIRISASYVVVTWEIRLFQNYFSSIEHVGKFDQFNQFNQLSCNRPVK